MLRQKFEKENKRQNLLNITLNIILEKIIKTADEILQKRYTDTLDKTDQPHRVPKKSETVSEIQLN